MQKVRVYANGMLNFEKCWGVNFEHAIAIVVTVFKPPKAQHYVFFKSRTGSNITSIFFRDISKRLRSYTFELTTFNHGNPLVEVFNSIFFSRFDTGLSKRVIILCIFIYSDKLVRRIKLVLGSLCAQVVSQVLFQIARLAGLERAHIVLGLKLWVGDLVVSA